MPGYFLQQTNGYYNWYAATAGSGALTTGGNASDSICPKGWKLPVRGNTSGTFRYLFSDGYGLAVDTSNIDSVKTAAEYPLNFIYSGYADSGSTVQEYRSIGIYTSATGVGDSNENNTYLHYQKNGLFIMDGSSKKTRKSVLRCVKK